MVINVQEQEALLQPTTMNKKKRQGTQRDWVIIKSVFTQICIHLLGNLVFSSSDHTKEKKSLCVRGAGVPVTQVNQPRRQTPSCTTVLAVPGQQSRATLVVLWHFAAIFLQWVVILMRQCPYRGWK